MANVVASDGGTSKQSQALPIVRTSAKATHAGNVLNARRKRMHTNWTRLLLDKGGEEVNRRRIFDVRARRLAPPTITPHRGRTPVVSGSATIGDASARAQPRTAPTRRSWSRSSEATSNATGISRASAMRKPWSRSNDLGPGQADPPQERCAPTSTHHREHERGRKRQRLKMGTAFGAGASETTVRSKIREAVAKMSARNQNPRK